MFHLLLLVYVMILDKIYFFENLHRGWYWKNKLPRSAARLGRGCQTRPLQSNQTYPFTIIMHVIQYASADQG